MKMWITGGEGQLGRQLRAVLAAGRSQLGPIPDVFLGACVVSVDNAPGAGLGLDISDWRAVKAAAEREMPDIIIHAAAYTHVDGCEENPDLALRANSLGTRNMAMAAALCGASLAAISTDYVFAGDRQDGAPYAEWDLPAPQSVYGKSKHLGEMYAISQCPRHYIVRTSWLYGDEGGNFVRTILRIAREKGALSVVNDQLGNPTYAEDLVHHILKILTAPEYGIYHVTGEGIASWYDFAVEIVRLAGLDCPVEPIPTARSGRAAARPKWSALSRNMLCATVGDEMRPWKQALAAFFEKNRP